MTHIFYISISALHKAGKQGAAPRYFSKRTAISALHPTLKIIKFKIKNIFIYSYRACSLTTCVCINMFKEDYKRLDVCKLEDEDSNESLRYEDDRSIALGYILCKYVWHNHSLHTSVHLSSFSHKSAYYLVAPCYFFFCGGH